jgi:hypothetical protein
MTWLESEPQFARLEAHAQRLTALQASLREAAPSLPLMVVAYEREVLVVGAAHAAIAAKIRQIEPTLVRALRQRGWPLRQIRIKPQFQAPPPTRTREIRPGPNAAAVAALGALAGQVSDPLLQSALRRLAARHQTGTTPPKTRPPRQAPRPERLRIRLRPTA